MMVLMKVSAALLVFAAAGTAAESRPRQPDDTPPDKVHPQNRVERGQAFLISLFDPELNLLPEFRGSKIYWLFHDNYLAARILAKSKPELSQRIGGALAKFGVLNSGKIEILFDEARQPLPFRRYQLTN